MIATNLFKSAILNQFCDAFNKFLCCNRQNCLAPLSLAVPNCTDRSLATVERQQYLPIHQVEAVPDDIDRLVYFYSLKDSHRLALPISNRVVLSLSLGSIDHYKSAIGRADHQHNTCKNCFM